MARGERNGRFGVGGRKLGRLGTMLVIAVAVAFIQAAPAHAQRNRQYGSNFAWGYSTPQRGYYNGPAYGMYGPYGPYPYYRNGGGNVQYFRNGRNAFWVETYRDERGSLRQRTGMFFGGR